MPIKAIIFDFGQVLNTPENPAAVREERTKLAARIGLEHSQLWIYLFEGEIGRLWMTGQISEDEFWIRVLTSRGITDPDEAVAYGREIFAHTYEMNGEMLALLEELKGSYLLAVLSNATWPETELREMLTNDMGIPADTFDVVVSSTTVGATKPDPKMYHTVLDRLGVEPGEAVFTDDLVNFALAAEKLGIHAQPFTSPEDFRRYLHQLGVLPIGSK